MLRAEPTSQADPLAWPAITSQTKPWTRWWWLGSAVDNPNLTRLLEQYHVYNPNTADAFLQFYDLAQGSVTVGTTTPKLSLWVPGGGALDAPFTVPVSFLTAITVCQAGHSLCEKFASGWWSARKRPFDSGRNLALHRSYRV